MDNEVVDGLVVLIVAQLEREMVGTLLAEGDNATVEACVQNGQAHVWLAIELHVPDTGATPVVEVAPLVDLALAADGDAVNIRTEHLATVYQQARMADTIVIVGGFRIVVGPQGEAYPAPCGEVLLQRHLGMLHLGVGLAETKGLLGKAAVEETMGMAIKE